MMEFVASIIASIAWPTAVLVAVLVFRKQLMNLIPALRRLRYKDLELEFSDSVRELSEKASREHLPLPTAEEEPLVERLAVIADISPRAAILEAWLTVETAALETAERFRLLPYGEVRRKPHRLGDYLQKAEILNADIREVFDRLRQLRNTAVHAPEAQFEPNVVRDYVALALSLAEYLRGLKPNA
jgi:hypothetical protein